MMETLINVTKLIELFETSISIKGVGKHSKM